MMSDAEQFTALSVLDTLSDLFTAATRESFTRDEILIVLNSLTDDPDIFDPDVVTAHGA
jgi:hypothetical protein